MNPVKFIIISLSLLFSHAAWAGDSDPVWIRRELARSWVKSGKIIIYDPGKANDRFPWMAIYVDRYGRQSPLLNNYWNVVKMIRCEFPDGVGEEFVQTNVVSVLTDFNSDDALVADGNVVAQIIEGLARLSEDGATQKLVRQLLDLPKVTVSKDGWSARFTTIAQGERVRLKIVKGKLRPFSIQSEVVMTLTDRDGDNFTAENLRDAIDRKNAVIASEDAGK